VTSYRSHTTCEGCGAEGEQVWVDSDRGLCTDCRVKGGNVDDKLVKQQVDLRRNETEGLRGRCEAIDVYDDDTYAEAAQAAQNVKRLLKDVSSEKARAVKPMNEALKAVRGWFAPVEAALGWCEDHLKGKMLDYQNAVAELNAETFDAARVAVEAGDTAAASTALAAITETSVAVGVSITETWDFRICNIGMVPTELLTVNTVKLRSAMREQIKDGREPCIPGVTFFKRQGIAVRT
jgi:hypothetical protein